MLTIFGVIVFVGNIAVLLVSYWVWIFKYVIKSWIYLLYAPVLLGVTGLLTATIRYNPSVFILASILHIMLENEFQEAILGGSTRNRHNRQKNGNVERPKQHAPLSRARRIWNIISPYLRIPPFNVYYAMWQFAFARPLLCSVWTFTSFSIYIAMNKA